MCHDELADPVDDPVDDSAATVDAHAGHHGVVEPDDPPIESWLAEVASAPEVAPGPAPGDVLADAFVIERRLGQGGMGVVFLAHQGALARKVAIKLHRAQSTGAAERLIREARAIAQVEHEHVIVVHEAGRWHDYVFVAMEYVDGWTAREWVEAAPRSWREIVELYRKAGLGLLAAHRRGLVHRDFKPDNVLVGRDGRVRVADFGLVRAAGQSLSLTSGDEVGSGEPPAASLTDGLVGTPAYMAPEQFRDAAVDAAADQFSFCVSLFEALDGRRPYAARDVQAQVKQLLRGVPRELDPSRAPTHVRAALRRGLAVHPDDRFAAMESLLHELGRDPAATWRRRAAVVTALGITGVATWAAARVPDPMHACEADVESSWTTELADRTRAALTSTARPFADDSFTRIDAALRARDDERVQLHAAACAAVHREGSHSLAQLAAHDRCMTQRDAEADALLELVVQRPEELVERSVAAVDSLPALASCDIERIGTDPVREEDRAQFDAMTRRIAEIDGLSAAGLYDEAVTASEALHDEVRELGYPAMEAALMLSLGHAHARLRQPELASERLQESLRLAIAADAHELAARTASLLLYVDGYQGAAHQRAEAWAMLAEDLLRRLGSPAALRVEFRTNHALALRTVDRFDASLAESAAGLAEIRPEQDLERAILLAIHAETERKRGNAPVAIALLEQSLGAYERAVGDAHPSYANALNLLATAQLWAGRLAEAEASLLRAMAIAEPAVQADSGVMVDIRGNLATVYMQTGRPAQALPLLEQVWADVRGSGRPPDRTFAMLAGNIAGVNYENGNGERARELIAEAIEINRVVNGEASVELAAAFVQSAAIHREHDPDAALVAVDRGLPILRERLGDAHPMAADARSTRGQLLERLGRCAEARVDLEAALAPLEQSVGADHPILGGLLMSRSRCRSKERDFAEAERDAVRAGELLKAASGEPSIDAGLAALRAQIGLGARARAEASLAQLRRLASADAEGPELRAELDELSRELRAG